MTVVVESYTPPTLLRVDGVLRVPVQAALVREVEGLLARGERRIVVDLTLVTDIDAAGIGELVRAFNAAAVAGGSLRISNPGRHVGALLDRAGLLCVLDGC